MTVPVSIRRLYGERLAPDFARYEFACRGEGCCGHAAPISMLLVHGLQFMRDQLGEPIIVLSGFRCLTHNQTTGSDETSQHPRGLAADIRVFEGWPVTEMLELAEGYAAFRKGGIGIYDWGIHVDVRGNRSRWDRRI